MRFFTAGLSLAANGRNVVTWNGTEFRAPQGLRARQRHGHGACLDAPRSRRAGPERPACRVARLRRPHLDPRPETGEKERITRGIP